VSVNTKPVFPKNSAGLSTNTSNFKMPTSQQKSMEPSSRGILTDLENSVKEVVHEEAQ